MSPVAPDSTCRVSVRTGEKASARVLAPRKRITAASTTSGVRNLGTAGKSACATELRRPSRRTMSYRRVRDAPLARRSIWGAHASQFAGVFCDRGANPGARHWRHDGGFQRLRQPALETHSAAGPGSPCHGSGSRSRQSWRLEQHRTGGRGGHPTRQHGLPAVRRLGIRDGQYRGRGKRAATGDASAGDRQLSYCYWHTACYRARISAG